MLLMCLYTIKYEFLKGCHAMPNVLIADDNMEIASVIKEYVQREGYNVFYAPDGEKAVELFKNEEFDMILLDVIMPGMDGFQV